MLAACLLLVLGASVVHGDSVVVTTSTEQPQNNSSTQSDKPDVYSLHIRSHIQYRYASTLVSSRVANRANISQEIFFSFVMPDTAFISSFCMEIDGVVYKAQVKEKEEAKRQYQQAVSQGQAAAHVAQSARNSNRFKVSVNIEPLKKVTFNMTYEELLKRELSFYTLAINIDPGQIVRDLSVDVHINESRPIKTLQVPVLKESNEIDSEGSTREDPYAEIEVSDHNTATVRWAPTQEQQRTLRADGIKGQLVVRYDLDRTAHPEQILVNEGYFVHFFSPQDLVPLPKHAVFVIDVSGSMWGRKIEQVRDALTRILSDLSPEDFFSFVTFSTDVAVWDLENPLAILHSNRFDVTSNETELRNSSVVAATSENINKAKEFVSQLDSYSSTNIHGALMKGLQVAQLGRVLTHGKPEPMIIFLTDGDANIGESNPDRIVASVSEQNVAGVAIFSLAFGEYADMTFLRKLSLKNSGFARKIYEASDASLQLRNFYRQIASPLLANVTFGYTENNVEKESLSTTSFSTLFGGSELVVSGRLLSDNVTGVVTARGVNGTFTLVCYPGIILPPVHQNSTPSFMERLWGYLTIQQLLERETAGTGNSSAIRQRALDLALRYSFVTPLTSLLVVKPNETSSADAERGDSIDSESEGHILYAAPRGPGGSPQAIHVPMMGLPGPPGPPGIYGGSLSGGHVADSLSYTTMATLVMQTAIVPPRPVLVPLDSVAWLNRTDNFSTVTLQANSTLPPETLLLKAANETNEAFSACNTTLGGPGHCRHLVHCALSYFQYSIFNYYTFFCRIDNYAGVCCPDSLQPVVLQN